jgi:hypothetical protein
MGIVISTVLICSGGFHLDNRPKIEDDFRHPAVGDSTYSISLLLILLKVQDID